MRSLITISGCSGAGKTALTDALAAKLTDILVIKFDEIDSLMSEPGDYAEWLARGADYAEFNLDRMKAHVAEVVKATPTRYVIFDYPYGKLHSAFREMIDLAIFVDSPLDVAMARRLLRDLPSDPIEAQHWVKVQLQRYLTRARNIYLHHVETVKPSCDLVLDGAQPLAELVAEVLASINQLERRGE